MLRQQKLIGLRGISIPVPQRLSFSESQNDFNAKPDAYANGNNRLTFSFLTLDVNTTYFNGLPHSQFHASSLFVFCAATNSPTSDRSLKPRQILYGSRIWLYIWP